MIEHELPIAWRTIDDRVRLGVLAAYTGQIVERHRKWVRAINPA